MSHLVKPSWLLIINTVIVFLGIAAYIASSISIIVFPSNSTPLEFWMALLFSPPLFLFGICLYRSVCRQNPEATKAATIIYFALAGLMIGGMHFNVIEGIYEGKGIELDFLIYFGSINLALTGYLSFLGYLSLKWWLQCRD